MLRPVDNFAEALAAVRAMRAEGVIDEYAVGGAIAHAFWSEPTNTFDLDVFVLLESSGMLISLDPIYRWAKRHGYGETAEHIVIAGIPVQLIPAHNELAVEAVQRAAELDYAGTPVRVITPEYLIAMYLEPSARSAKRLARVGDLLETELDRALLDSLLQRYKLELPR